MTAVSYPMIRRQRTRLRSIGGVALLVAVVLASQREPVAVRRAGAPPTPSAAHPRPAPAADLYATAVAP